MIFNLDNPLQREQFITRAAHLADRGGLVELTSRRPKTPSQNSYLHSIISYFALQYGDSAEFCKVEYFKKAANPDIFWAQRHNEIRGSYRTLRSTAHLSAEELSLAIDRFRNWAASVAGIYLPSPDDYQAMQQIDIEIQQNLQYI